MINRIFFFLFLFLSIEFHAQITTAIYGNLWSNNQELTCNWYFKENHAVLELIDVNEPNIATKFHFLKDSKYIYTVSQTNSIVSRSQVHVDSIQGELKAISLFQTGKPQEFDSFGMAKRHQARSTTVETIAYSVPFENLSINMLTNKLKNDPVLQWFSTNMENEFPIHYMVTKINGELLISYLASEYSTDFDQSIFAY